MALIYETENFTVESHPEPFVSREEGGHIKIIAKRQITDRTQFTPKEAIEFIRLSMIVGEAFKLGMQKNGVNIIHINYEELGNWAFKRGEVPQFHLQIFGRVEGAKKQIFPEAVYLPDRSTGFYSDFKPLTVEDIQAIRIEIERLVIEERFQASKWRL